MELKGYKHTEIGLIPEDWKLVSFDDAFKFLSTASFSRAELSIDDQVKYIHYGDIHTKFNHNIDIDNDYLPSVAEVKSRRYALMKNGDVVMADASEDLEGLGKCIEIKNLSNSKAISGLHTFLFRDKKNFFSNGFKGYLSYNPLIKNQLNKYSTGLKVYSISKSALKKIQIPLPQLSEQKAIANALQDIDGLIEKQKTLIAKKKDIKQGTMQLLLSGKKRLAGFKDTWEVKKLGQVAEITGAGVDKKINKNEEEVKLLNYLDVYRRDYIYSNELNHVVTATKLKVKQCNIMKGDVLITPSSELSNDIGITALSMEDMEKVVYSYHLYRIRFFIELDWIYKLFIFKNSFFLNQAEKYAEGSGKRYVISLAKMRELYITYPKQIKEQNAIAEILLDMDIEIQALEKQLVKYQNIKQGVMQELLTGRTRII